MRLPRPTIPLRVKCLVALRQIGEIWPERVVAEHDRHLGELLSKTLARLAELLGCEPKELRLDHDPALGAREKIKRGDKIVGYVPDANDPEALLYRTNAAHLIKTNVRGDGAQHPDRVLIKKMRRAERRALLLKTAGRAVNAFNTANVKPKRFKSRPLRSANRWPPRGTRKINWRASPRRP